VRDARLRQRVRNLRAHAADDLMVFQGHDAAGTGLDRRADRIEINAIDERIVDHGGLDVLLGKFFPGFDGFANQQTQRLVVMAVQKGKFILALT